MNEAEALATHKALWSQAHNPVHYKGETYYPVLGIGESRNFAKIELPGGLLVITQNLAKRSPNTDWVNKDPNNKLTWIIKDGRYVGKITTTVKDGKTLHRVYKLNPERIIKTFREDS